MISGFEGRKNISFFFLRVTSGLFSPKGSTPTPAGWGQIMDSRTSQDGRVSGPAPPSLPELMCGRLLSSGFQPFSCSEVLGCPGLPSSFCDVRRQLLWLEKMGLDEGTD